MSDTFKSLITDVPDFPRPGILFRDISPLLKSPQFKDAIKAMGNLTTVPDYWVGIESRGFIFATALALEFGGGIVLLRKKNKLPPPKIGLDYELEYGADRIEIHPGSGNVVLVDDVVATGGTLIASERLLKEAGYNIIDKLVLINIKSLNSFTDVKSLIDYE